MIPPPVVSTATSVVVAAFLSDGSQFTIKPTSMTATPTHAPTDENSSSSGASDHNSVAETFAGIAVGAVIGVTLGIVLAAVVVVLVVVRKQKRKRYSPPVVELNENLSYGNTYRDPKVERNVAYGSATDAASRMVRNTGLGKSSNVNNSIHDCIVLNFHVYL